MKQKFLICQHCGNIVAMIRDKGVPIYCCGEEMQELIPGTAEASGEKHIPVYAVEGNTVCVTDLFGFVAQKFFVPVCKFSN